MKFSDRKNLQLRLGFGSGAGLEIMVRVRFRFKFRFSVKPRFMVRPRVDQDLSVGSSVIVRTSN